MYQLILLIHVFAAVFIVALVLVQQGRGATVGAAFGSGASQTVFGSRGSGSFLFRLTMSMALIFFITSMGLNYLASHARKQQNKLNVPVAEEPAASTVNKSAVPAAGDAPANNIPMTIPAQTLPIDAPVNATEIPTNR